MSHRKIKKLIVHCSDSDRPEHDDISVIKKWHLERGWLNVGYHFFINKFGEIQQGRHTNEVGAHCMGENLDSVGICLGGKNEFSEAQFKSLRALVKNLRLVFNLREDRVFPHNHFDKGKTCPNFDVNAALHPQGSQAEKPLPQS